jgi:hypothetical protein
MAQSPAHALGQIIGNLIEETVGSILADFTIENSLFLDTHGKRESREGCLLIGEDNHGNKHALDFVLEKNGSGDVVGEPVAYIEVGWRRYKKHSKNKVQEIESALKPIAIKHADSAPFLGVILVGEFTQPSLQQMRTTGWNVVYVPSEIIWNSFQKTGHDIYFDNNTPEHECQQMASKLKLMSNADRTQIIQEFASQFKSYITPMLVQLKKCATRKIKTVQVEKHTGMKSKFKSPSLAAKSLKQPQKALRPFYRVKIKYNDGTSMRKDFDKQKDVKCFLVGL